MPASADKGSSTYFRGLVKIEEQLALLACYSSAEEQKLEALQSLDVFLPSSLREMSPLFVSCRRLITVPEPHSPIWVQWKRKEVTAFQSKPRAAQRCQLGVGLTHNKSLALAGSPVPSSKRRGPSLLQWAHKCTDGGVRKSLHLHTGNDECQGHLGSQRLLCPPACP